MADDAIDLKGRELYSTDNFVFPDQFRKDVKGILVPEGLNLMRCDKLSQEIHNDCQDEEILAIIFMKGSMFVAHNILSNRHYQTKAEMFPLWASSYEGTESTGRLTIKNQEEFDAKLEKAKKQNKTILCMEDIVDTGLTLGKIKEYMLGRGILEKKLKIASLINKPCRRLPEFETLWIDYLGFTIDDHFVVGGGLDFNEQYRELGDICVLKPEVYK